MKFVISILFGAIFFASCQKPDELAPVEFSPQPCTDTISFLNEIKAQIIDKSCNVNGCHDATAEGDLTLQTHVQIAAATHISWFSMVREPGYPAMPPSGEPIADSLLQKFHCWIAQGKLDN